MKRLIKRMSLFVCFFVAFYLLVMFVVASTTVFTGNIEKLLFTNPTAVGGNYSRTLELDEWLNTKNDSNASGLMLGSSTFYRNVDPAILGDKTGIDFFCAASSNQCLANSQYILEYSLSAGKKIDHLFLGIDHMLWDMDGLECSTDWLVNNYNPHRKFVFQMAAHSNNYLLWIYYAYFVIKRSLPFTKEYILADVTNDKYMGKGFVCCDDGRQTDALLPYEFADTISTGNYKALLAIIEICKARKINLTLYLPKILNIGLDRNCLREIDVPVVDATVAPIDTTLFYDNYHLRCSGTKPYTEWVAEQYNGFLGQ